MKYHDVLSEKGLACEMYSKRMRTLYTRCGSTDPPDSKPLLEFSAHRRAVYDETIPPLLEIIRQGEKLIERQKMLGTMSSHYMLIGQMQENTNPSLTTFGPPGVGYGYANGNTLQGAIYGKQAAEGTAAMSNSNSRVEQDLRAKWNAVEQRRMSGVRATRSRL